MLHKRSARHIPLHRAVIPRLSIGLVTGNVWGFVLSKNNETWKINHHDAKNTLVNAGRGFMGKRCGNSVVNAGHTRNQFPFCSFPLGTSPFV